MTISSSNVYIAGRFEKVRFTTYAACYWINGVIQNLYIPKEATFPQAADVAVSGTNLYFVGSYRSASGIYVACFWKNGKRYYLDIPLNATFSTAKAISISRL